MAIRTRSKRDGAYLPVLKRLHVQATAFYSRFFHPRRGFCGLPSFFWVNEWNFTPILLLLQPIPKRQDQEYTLYAGFCCLRLENLKLNQQWQDS